MDIFEVWSDGSSHASRDKPGGWAYIITENGQILCASFGGDPKTTNNRMEMTGALEGLKKLSTIIPMGVDYSVTLKSDSQYTLGIANGSSSPSKNVDLAVELRRIAKALGVTTEWIPGHSGIELNERCDRLAKRGKLENTPDKLKVNISCMCGWQGDPPKADLNEEVKCPMNCGKILPLKWVKV